MFPQALEYCLFFLIPLIPLPLQLEKLDLMFEESLKLSSKFGISNWVKNYYDIINYLKDR